MRLVRLQFFGFLKAAQHAGGFAERTLRGGNVQLHHFFAARAADIFHPKSEMYDIAANFRFFEVDFEISVG